MSLKIRGLKFKLSETKMIKVVKLTFRDNEYWAKEFKIYDNIVYTDKYFEWRLNTPATRGECITVTVFSSWFFKQRILGRYNLGMHYLISEDEIPICEEMKIVDSLINDSNCHVSVFIEILVRYTPPSRPTITELNADGDVASNRSEQSSGDGSAVVSEDEETLHAIKRNIDNVEKSIMREKGLQFMATVSDPSSEESRANRLKMAGKSLLRRGLSVSSNLSKSALQLPPKRSTLRSVRNIMRFGRMMRSRLHGDETEELLEPVAGPSSAPDYPVVESSDGLLVDTSMPPDAPLKKLRKNRIMEEAGSTALKAGDFQVCVTVIEVRQLAGLNMDPVVCVQIGDNKKYTSVKESTNCPYYNEYFVFDFHMPPIMLFDKIITLSVLQSRNFLRGNKLLGSFKMDVSTVWNQPDRQFYHKWALLTDPEDIAAGAKGYLKCDISVIGKGDIVKIPPKSEKDEDDIEANLLIPDGVPIERQRAKFFIKIHKADGLPKMNYSLFANMKRAITGESLDLTDSYVQVSFAGLTADTSVKHNSYSPVWNEQVVFTEMIPPLCQRIRIQLRDRNPVHQAVIGTHFIDLKSISNDVENGFLPTFGPSYVYLYGSMREYSFIDKNMYLNSGIGQGVAYRARLLISIRTEILDIINNLPSVVEFGISPPLNEQAFFKNAEFFLFSSVFEASMIDKRLADKPLHFELSIGNAGNTLDGHYDSIRYPQGLQVDLDKINVDMGYWQSTTEPMNCRSTNQQYYFLPYMEGKPCMHVRTVWPDQRRRMYNSNLIAAVIEKFEEALTDAQLIIESTMDNSGVIALKTALDTASGACADYVASATNSPPLGNTKLDKERLKMCLQEVAQLATLTRKLRALVTKHSLNDRLKTAYTYLNNLKQLCEDPQHAMPDIYIWLISKERRIAYQRIPARDIIYSSQSAESGRFCGKMQTLCLKWPGKKAASPSGWPMPAKINVYFWLGILADKGKYIDGLPPGYDCCSKLINADLLRTDAPQMIYYKESHFFQLRAYVYQARSLIGSDSSGLSDPYAKIIIGQYSNTTQVIDQTLSPTWDELLLFRDLEFYCSLEQLEMDPPTIVVEIFDQDNVGKSEFIGRTLAKPQIYKRTSEQAHVPPALEWFEIRRGEEHAGELLAAFELIQKPDNDSSSLPQLPSPRKIKRKTEEGDRVAVVYPVPREIRPTLSKYRIEVLFWGLRYLKRVHLLKVVKPRVDIECAGHIIHSTVIPNAQRNPNFSNPFKFIDLQLPDQDLYRPPLTIRVIDCRSFGRITLVGTHTINSIKKYIHTPKTKKERIAEERNKSLIKLESIDLHGNSSHQDDVIFTFENERENCPLLMRGRRTDTSYSSGVKEISKGKRGSNRDNLKGSTKNSLELDDCSKDWWTKYFASVEAMIENEKEKKRDRKEGEDMTTIVSYVDETVKSLRVEKLSPRAELTGARSKKRGPTSPRNKATGVVPKNKEIPRSALTKIYPHELEAVPEFDEFKEWLQSFDLYRGKKTGFETEDDSRVVGTFKGALKVYKWPLPRGTDELATIAGDPNHGLFQGVPNNEPIHVLVRVYVVKATDLHPMDLNGKADPYINLNLGSKRIHDKDNYFSKQLNPVFGKSFEIEATFPQDSMLNIQVLDSDLLGSDDLIGETKIDLENRFYSKHRATCGLPLKYEEKGYNRWRDAFKPSQILVKLCKDGKLEPPVYEIGRVKIGRTVFNLRVDDKELFSNPKHTEEQMSLMVLHRWHEVPKVGCHLVPEHIETRPLYNPNKPGVEQGRLHMWVDMFPMDMPLPGPALDISPRKPKSYVLRVIVWNTDDVVLEDDAFFTGEKMSDIYVKGWMKGPNDCQSTDVHYRSLTGEGNFNWRFIYPFDYLEAEERIVVSRKESVFSWDETERKIPPRLELQVWDTNHFTSDEFLGAMTLDLNRFPRGAKSSKLCTLDMLSNDGSVPMVNIFKQKRAKGWWPFYIKRENEEMELTGKVEAELHLLTKEEAEKVPAGLGRNEPDPLDKPNRPDSSFMWLLNPLKSLRYIAWHNYKWDILKFAFIIFFVVMIMFFFYAFPGYSAKKILGA